MTITFAESYTNALSADGMSYGFTDLTRAWVWLANIRCGLADGWRGHAPVPSVTVEINGIRNVWRPSIFGDCVRQRSFVLSCEENTSFEQYGHYIVCTRHLSLLAEQGVDGSWYILPAIHVSTTTRKSPL